VAKLSPGQDAYYERSVVDGIDDYYAGRGESPGVWVGRGAAELELDGVVDDGQLGRLIGGKHPLTSAELRRHPPRKRITVERIDPSSGERTLEVKTLSPVAGYDLVFSPPKSLSLLHALGSEEVRTNCKLTGLGVLGRVRHGRALRDELGEHEQRLARLDQRLEQLDRELRVTRARIRAQTRRADARAEPAPGAGRACDRAGP
jgi:hypothetical protein